VYVAEGITYTLYGHETPAEQVRLHREATARLERQRLLRAEQAEIERDRPTRAIERCADALERIAAALEK
jgi:hypothetical protein